MENMIENTITASQEKAETEGKKMIKYIIRECANPDFSEYFDTDCFDGDACKNYSCYLFILHRDRWNTYHGVNEKEYKYITEKAGNIIDGFEYAEEKGKTYDGKRYTYKDCMEEQGYKYNSTLCSKLKKWYMQVDIYSFNSIAAFLTITTGKEWKTMELHGYCQGDYCTVVYCAEQYTDDQAAMHGSIWLGCAKEFSVTELDDNGEEIDTVFGYYVADSQTWKNEGYKKIVCKYAGISQEETELYMIKNRRMVETYDYEIV